MSAAAVIALKNKDINTDENFIILLKFDFFTFSSSLLLELLEYDISMKVVFIFCLLNLNFRNFRFSYGFSLYWMFFTQTA